jgi:hypothetical protein
MDYHKVEQIEHCCLELRLLDFNWRSALDEAAAVSNKLRMPVRLSYHGGGRAWMLLPDTNASELAKMKEERVVFGV